MTKALSKKPNNILANYKALTFLLITIPLALTNNVNGQVSDGDEQFQVFHQDIGRISGLASSNQNQVAPQTTIVRQQQPVAVAHAPASVSQAEQPRQAHKQRAQPTRRPNRITLAVRTSAPLQVSFPDQEPVGAQSPRVVELASNSFASSQLVAPPPQQLPQPQFQPLDHSAHAAQSSFRSALAHPSANPNLNSNLNANPNFEGSVPNHHAALVAQVAAERAAVSPTTLLDFPQPSLGSPIEALSAPAPAQVQPPPTAPQASQHQAAAAQPAFNFVNQPEEPIVAPSFDHVLGHGCPRKGVFSYENKDYCDRYYMCTNGTFTEEACPNGLAYGQMGAVYQHCAYNWNVDCGRKKTSTPIASPGCPWQFGIFPVSQAGQCSIDYFVCEWGVPETKRCSPEGLFYDDRIKGCQWADQLGCKSEALLNFKCPAEDEDNPYWPYPRYYHTKQDIIVCVNEQPRLVHCNEEQIVDPSSLACMDLKKKNKKRI